MAHAVEIVGDRWGLLIVRDLLVQSLRFTDLRAGLPKIPSNILSKRLKEMESEGIVRRGFGDRGSVVYELTEYGRGLEDVVLALGRWGARTLGDPRPDDIITSRSMTMAMRTTFRPEAAQAVTATIQLRLGDVAFWVRIERGTLRAEPGECEAPDATFHAGPGLKLLMNGTLTAAEALEQEVVRVEGDAALLETFADAFGITPLVEENAS